MMNYATQYPTSHYPPAPGPGSAPLPPEGPHLHQQHQGGQPSPVLPSQDQRYQQPSGQPPHPQMYNAAYGMQSNMQQQFMTPGQAAAMATAAAAGSAGGYYERTPRTPPGGPNPMPQALPSQPHMQQQPRRMSNHASGPHVPNSHPPAPAAAGRPVGGPTNSMPPPPMQHGGPAAAPPVQNTSPDPPPPAPGQAEESPLYVNAKQFHRILKRRVARQRLEEALRLTSKGRRPYLHESRHRHAMRRPRGPGGRFLTAEEVARMENGEGLPQDADGEDNKENHEEGGGAKKSKGDKKRKSQGGGGRPSKKRRGSSEAEEEEEEEDDEEGDE